MSMLFSRRNESLEQPSTTREPLISPLPAFLEEQSSAPPASRAFRAEPASPALPHKLPRRTKAHVASACVNCKKKHLGCDPARPCRRCVLSGKEVCHPVPKVPILFYPSTILGHLRRSVR
ncbi:hypothetical protein BO82DRAFT_64943 [Aspergillus uvarum CBS 121591]|uniref:Transcription activator of gluconeogenesis acuK n=1 Tax=Aspergillus uvarum CBS 121591 TaxID=1448315 RepID=A0A319CDE6_9EURO|nr:hypothetical protein BO82DRAFT_64943 [Aspergillus uvarum CBS 121591]PYH82279.1 hypothetical protein BO82DRAFT_64943 [Aspergillus uvarum CBS 121591]